MSAADDKRIQRKDTKDFKPDSLLQGLDDYTEFKYDFSKNVSLNL